VVDPHTAALAQTIEAISTLLEDETGRLQRCEPFDIESFNQIKQQRLQELDRNLRTLRGRSLPEALAGRLKALRTTIETNMSTLSLHLAAMNEVTRMIVTSIRKNESDGTYGRRGTNRSYSR
jgi:hypothetical protein